MEGPIIFGAFIVGALLIAAWVFWSVILWRAMRAHERLADAHERQADAVKSDAKCRQNVVLAASRDSKHDSKPRIASARVDDDLVVDEFLQPPPQKKSPLK